MKVMMKVALCVFAVAVANGFLIPDPSKRALLGHPGRSGKGPAKPGVVTPLLSGPDDIGASMLFAADGITLESQTIIGFNFMLSFIFSGAILFVLKKLDAKVEKLDAKVEKTVDAAKVFVVSASACIAFGTMLIKDNWSKLA